MKIGFFSEAGYQGGIPRNHPNMRTDVAWVCALNAYHHPLKYLEPGAGRDDGHGSISLSNIPSGGYDVGIVIIPKYKRHLIKHNLIKQIKQFCKTVCVMQESTYWYWQDDFIEEQVWYFNNLMDADLILCHNDDDLNYYRGMTGKRCELLPSLMITDNLDGNDSILPCGGGSKEGVVIGGNFVSIYRGFDSYVVAKRFGLPVHAPTTGRMKPEERGLDIKHLDWVSWYQWIHVISKFYAGVQLGTPAAGTFNLNLSFHGIPCIGYDNLNTQAMLHPETTVKDGHVDEALELADRLNTDIGFYEKCSRDTRRLYEQHYSEEVFVKNMMEIFESL